MATHDESYFQDMLAEVRAELLPQIPSIDDELMFSLKQSLAAVMAAQKHRDKCKQAQKQAKEEDEKKRANEDLVAAEKELEEATSAAVETSTPILTNLHESFLANDSLDPLLVKCSILSTSSKQLAEYCQRDDENANLVDRLFSDDALMRDMLYNGGAKGGSYGQAMELYTKLTELIATDSDDEDGVLIRLALGTSLEQAVPVQMFGAKKKHIDPISRFQHYQEAYRHQELDPTFASASS